MAGGEGSRLRPLTSNTPKPMLPLVNRPMMEHIVTLLQRHGCDEIVVTVAYLANAIRTYFGDGSELGVRIRYATEERPLGTAGSVRNAMDELDERFLVISGDVLTDIDLTRIVERHIEVGALATIGLTPVENPLEFGIVITREDGSIERFLEKPSWGQVFSDTVNSGIFVFEPEIFQYIASDRPVDFSSEVFPELLASGKPLFGAIADGYWEDVGNLDSYVRAHRDILDGKVDVDIPGFRLSDGVWLGSGAEVDPDAIIEGPAVIGDNCRIAAGARLGPYSVLGANVRVRTDVDLERVVIHDNAYLDEGAWLRGTVVGRAGNIRRAVRCEEGAVLGDECFVADAAVIGTGVKVYPFKTVESGALVKSSIVWESRGQRNVFGVHGVSGLANVDITSEQAVRLAMAFASTVDTGSLVVTSRDSSRAARMLKRAMMSGLNAAGVNVLDLEVTTVPATRFQVRRPSVSGGVTIRIKDGDPQSVIIRFLGPDGTDLGTDAQRKIERMLHREDFRRVLPAEIGDIGLTPRGAEQYADALAATFDTDRIRAAGFKVVVDYGSGSSSLLMPNVLAKMDADVLAVNPYVSTPARLRYQRDRNGRQVAELVRASGSDLGVVIGPDGEHLTLIDESGHVLTDIEGLLIFLSLLPFEDPEYDTVALPVHTPNSAIHLVEQRGGRVELVKTDTVDLHRASLGPRSCFAASLDGGYIIPSFLAGFDAAAGFTLLLELLARADRPLGHVVAELRATHIFHDTVATPWEQKGAVMRSLVEQTSGPTVLIDGLKVLFEDGWILALPDPEEASMQLWAEAGSEAAARERVSDYAKRISRMVGP